MSSKIKVDTIENVAGSGNVSLGSGHNLVVPGSISAKGGAVFNEDSADVDFRVESNGEANMLFVDGGNDRVGIGTTGGSGETLTVTKTGADATVRINGVSSQEAALKLQGNNTVTNTFKIASEQDDSGLTIQKWNGSAYVTHLKSDANGHITKPLQPAFLVFSTDSNDFPLNDTRLMTLDTEVFDQNGDVASNVFTAPVTGRYNLSLSLYFTAIASDSNYLEVYLTTSNRTYYFIIDPGTFDQTGAYHTITASVLADMDASDTASVSYRQSSGSSGTDFDGDNSFFSGYLAC